MSDLFILKECVKAAQRGGKKHAERIFHKEGIPQHKYSEGFLEVSPYLIVK